MTRIQGIPSSVLLLGVLLLVAPACRSDGGIGRRDSARGLSWTSGVIARQHAADVDRTVQNSLDLADWFAEEISDPTGGLERTLTLYLEGNTRSWAAEHSR